MTDLTINRYVASGTQSQRLAFTPAPATPASGPNPLCIWYETDTGYTYLSANAGAWVRVNDGLPWKPNCRAATTGTLPANTYANGTSGVGATLTASANGALAAQDGVTLVVNDRLLVKNEATGANNGIYVLTQVGSVSLPYILTRATDADSGAELVNAVCKISEGSTLADQEWQCTTNATITVGTTAQTWLVAGGGGSGITALTGDVTASGSGSVAATLASSGVTAATYGDSTHSAQIAVDAKGRITSASSVAITTGEANLSTPAASSYTLQNTGTSSASTVSNGIYFSVPLTTPSQIRFLKNTAGPGSFTSFTIIARCKIAAIVSTTAASYIGAIVFRNSGTGKILIFSNAYQGGAQYLLQRWTDYATFSATVFGPTAYGGAAPNFPWMKVTVSGGTATFYLSPDGVNWASVGTETVATFISSIDEVGVGSMSYGTVASCVFSSITVV